MKSYEELMSAVKEVAAAIFATAASEAEVCELEKVIYSTINAAAAARIAQLG